MGGSEPLQIDISERGADGQRMDKRLFMQLLVFGGCDDTAPLCDALKRTQIQAVLYEQVHDPLGVGLLTMHEDPAFFLEAVRQLVQRPPFAGLPLKPHLTMFGRTYALGYEPDLQEVLFDRPRRHALADQWPWAVWYPLRRSGAFEQLDTDQQRAVLMEHGKIGMAFGRADYAHDIRLACHGLDESDNDFVVGLVGKQLAGLSAVVQRMRKTQQTSRYLERLGPFFVGRAIWRSELRSDPPGQ